MQANGVVRWYSYGNCANQIMFQMQTKECGIWGCHWNTRNHGRATFFWEESSGVVARKVGVSCRKGTHSYRMRMVVFGVVSEVEEGVGVGPGIIGSRLENVIEDGPETKISC